MALIPSLSLWSSIKIPFSLYGKEKFTPSVPRVESCKHLKKSICNKEAEPARQMVNLIVPTSLSKETSDSSPLTHLRILSTGHKKGAHRKCSSKPKTKQIGYVVVPSGNFPDKSNYWQEIIGNNYEKALPNSKRSRATLLGDDLYDKCPEFDIEAVCGECDHVPSIKPWLKEELDEINRKYKLLEHKKTLKMTEDKNRRINKRKI